VTGAEAINLITFRLARGGDAAIRAQVLLELKLAQATLEKGPTLPWFLEQKITSGVTIAANPSVALPASFIREVEEGAFYVVNPSTAKPVELHKDDYDFLRLKYADADNAQPESYAIFGSNYELFPTPDAVYSLVQNIYVADTAPADSAATNLWLATYPELLIGEVGMVVASLHVSNEKAYTFFKEQAQKARDTLMRNEVARKEANNARRMGGED
jgi:hypothetical protein